MPTRADIDRLRGRAARRKRAMAEIGRAVGEYLAGRITGDEGMTIIASAIRGAEKESTHG